MAKVNDLNQHVIYGLDIETFMDANGDGVGDFIGATSKLDYLADLGVSCIWLLPFYETPNKDNGYDIVDYYRVDHRLGSLEDFFDFVGEAHKRDIKIIVDFVYHHTSDQHPWFQVSRIDPKSKFRKYYIWNKTIPDPTGHEDTSSPAMPGEQSGVWKYDHLAKEYYYHRFYDQEPDLNIANPDVQNELLSIMDFWLSYGVDGFRVDAATMMFQDKGLDNTAMKNPKQFMEKMRALVKAHQPNGFLLAEADVKDDENAQFVEGDNKMNMLLNFILNGYCFSGLATEENKYLLKKLKDQFKPPAGAVWINFLRNLDELNLWHLPEAERKRVFKILGPDPDMLVYGRGVRRRLAPMLDGNQDRLKMAFALLFSLPGSTMFVYGDEIGMGDNQNLYGRWAVRTPMQWTSDKNGGYSEAPENKLSIRPIHVGSYSFAKINVAQQLANPNSLLKTVKKLIEIKRSNPEISSSSCEVLDFGNRHIIGLTYEKAGRKLVCICNLSHEKCLIKEAELKVENPKILIENQTKAKANNAWELNSYGFIWLQSNV